MATTSSRMLQLLSLLQTQRYWPGSELAERLEVSIRTLRRDVGRLRELGYPVQAHRGVDGGYQLAAGASLPPLVLDDEEAVALAVGLMAAASSGIAGTAESSLRALAKVVQVMPARLRRQADALAAMTEPAPWLQEASHVDPDVLTTCALGCRDTERLHFSYTAADGASQQRHVEPHRLVCLGRRWYLVAYDLERHDWRSFRLDRMAVARRTGARFAARTLPAQDAVAFVREGIETFRTSFVVEATVALDAEVVRSRIGRWSHVEATAEGTCLVRMRAESFDWPAMVLGGLGSEFSVRTPPELVEYLAEWAARFGRAVKIDLAAR